MIQIRPSYRIRSSPEQNSTTQHLFERASQLVTRLAQHVSAQQSSASHFDEVESTLGTLPLATDEFAVALGRLRNARGAMAHGEWGAACYELRLLAGCLFCSPRR